jgi:hypothetical protein
MKIRYAEGIIDTLDFSNYNVYNNTYPNSYFLCDNCDEKIRFDYKDLDNHRFLKQTNLTGKEKITADRLILSMIPKYKIKQKGQIWALNSTDRYLVMLQRFFLRFTGRMGHFLPVPGTDENIPDSFIDYYCPKCQAPVRIYYCSFIGGRQAEISYRIKYVIN